MGFFEFWIILWKEKNRLIECCCLNPTNTCAHGKGLLLLFRDLLKWNLEVIVSSQRSITSKSVFLDCVAVVDIRSCCSSGTQRNEVFIFSIFYCSYISAFHALYFWLNFSWVFWKKHPESVIFPSSFSILHLTMVIPNIVLMFVDRFWILWTICLLLQRAHNS